MIDKAQSHCICNFGQFDLDCQELLTRINGVRWKILIKSLPPLKLSEWIGRIILLINLGSSAHHQHQIEDPRQLCYLFVLTQCHVSGSFCQPHLGPLYLGLFWLIRFILTHKSLELFQMDFLSLTLEIGSHLATGIVVGCFGVSSILYLI